MTLGLAMIVRDAEADLEACLGSVAGVVDEIVIADTGSRDGTAVRARALGARVIEVPWEDDFARARNLGLEQMRSDWVLVLDADERLDLGEAAERGRWQAQFESGADAFQVTIRNYVNSLDARVWDRPAVANDGRWPEARGYPGFVSHQNVRLFRRRPELRFSGRLHESVGPQVRAHGLRLTESAGLIHHFGLALAPDAQAAKNRRYRELARRKAEEAPTDAQAQFEWGLMEFDNFHQDAAALRCFERALRAQPGFTQAWFYGGAALLRLGHPAEALEFFAQAAARGYATALLNEMMGDAHYNLGRHAEAAARYRAAARLGSRQPGGHPGLGSKLGLAELRAGRRDRGWHQLRAALAAAPELAENHDRLVAAHVWSEDWAAAVAALRARIARFPAQTEGYLRLAGLQRQLGQAEEAAQSLRQGLRQVPGDAGLRSALNNIDALEGAEAKACAGSGR